MSLPGKVYLAACGEALPAMAARVLASFKGKRPRIAVSYAATAGSPDGRGYMARAAAKSFPGCVLERFTLPGEDDHTPGMPAAHAIILGADVVFLTGGDPVLGAKILTESGADAWLREAHARGAPCLGVSAGSIMLCARWASWPEEAPPGAAFDGGSLVRCTGVVSDLVVDCHAEDDAWIELVQIAQMLKHAGENPRLRGLSTGSGVIVQSDGSLEIVGDAPFEIPDLDTV